MNTDSQPDKEEVQSEQNTGSETKRTIESAEIFQGQREIIVQHEGVQYRLRLTRNGKLILHK